MNKSMWFLFAGIISGILVTSLINPFGNRSNITGYDAQLEKITDAIEELNSTTSKLQNLVQMYTHVLPPTESINKNTQIFSTQTLPQAGNNVDLNNSNTQQDGFATTYPMNEQTNYIEPTPPTPDQIEQYNSIETELYNSTNNSNVSLTKLIEKANNLTPEQKNALTLKALEMIKRGELNANQFTGRPNS